MTQLKVLFRPFAPLFAFALAVRIISSFSPLVVAPAHAADITNISVTSTGPLTAGQPNSAPIVVTYNAPTAMAANSSNSSWVGLFGPNWVTDPVSLQCGSLATVQSDQNLTLGCSAGGGAGFVYAQSISSDAQQNWPANTTWTFTFAANTITLPYAASMSVTASTFLAVQDGTRFDTGQVTVPLAGYVAPSKTVIFDANGGSGSMANQTASAAAALTSNTFARPGYQFAGWNTAANGTGTAYANGASYPFSADVTLYAQWTPVLALTGSANPASSPFLFAGVLIVAGAGLVIAIRRTQRVHVD